jgi:hypothetical protein
MTDISPDRSINCYFCGSLADERDCVNADARNGDDGGSMCQQCSGMTAPQTRKLSRITQGLEENGVSVESVDVLMSPVSLPTGWASVVIKADDTDRVYGISPEGDSHS